MRELFEFHSTEFKFDKNQRSEEGQPNPKQLASYLVIVIEHFDLQ